MAPRAIEGLFRHTERNWYKIQSQLTIVNIIIYDTLSTFVHEILLV